MSGRAALVAGSTGLVGRELLRRLTATPEYSQITALTRRPLDGPAGGPVRAAVVDFNHLEAAGEALTADHVYCALGTTIRKAGSREAFRRVDRDYVQMLASMARAHGARHFLLVSSLGADPRSRFFYLRVKGEVEAVVQAVGYPSVTILRPSLLLGDRDEFRLGEALVKPLGWLMPRRQRPVHARAVAATMVRTALEDRHGVQIIESRDITRAHRDGPGGAPLDPADPTR